MAKDQIDNNNISDSVDEKDLEQYGVWVSSESQDSTEPNDSAELLDFEEPNSLSDDLSDLNDLLLSIDEEEDQDDTIYLEEDSMSIDLDADTNDLIAETSQLQHTSETIDSEFDDIQIPSLDGEEITLTIEADDTDEFSIPSPFDEETDAVEPMADMNSEEATDFDNSLQNSLADDDLGDLGGLGEELDDLSIDEDASIQGLEPPSDEDILVDVTAMAEESDSDSMFNEDCSSDESADLVLDALEDEEIVLDDYQDSNELDLVESGFDDVSALTEDLLDETSNPLELPEDLSTPIPDLELSSDLQTPAMVNNNNESDSQSTATAVLSSIEKELFAIRKELTDLRSELKRLRSKDSQIASSNSTSEADLPLGETTITETIDQAAIVDDKAEQDSQAVDTSVSYGFEQTSEEKINGFFEDDEDETIALTGDELDNILNSAEFTEEAGEPTVIDEDNSLSNIDTETASTIPTTADYLPSEPLDNDLVEQANQEPIAEIDLDDELPMQENQSNLQSMASEEFAIGSQTESPEQTENIDTNSLEAFEDSTSDSISAIEEITLEEIEDEPLEDLDDTGINNELIDNFPESIESAEVQNMANLDIEQELAGIDDLGDSNDDLEFITEDHLPAIEFNLPMMDEASEESVTLDPESDFEKELSAEINELASETIEEFQDIVPEDESAADSSLQLILDTDEEIASFDEQELGMDSEEITSFNEQELVTDDEEITSFDEQELVTDDEEITSFDEQVLVTDDEEIASFDEQELVTDDEALISFDAEESLDDTIELEPESTSLAENNDFREPILEPEPTISDHASELSLDETQQMDMPQDILEEPVHGSSEAESLTADMPYNIKQEIKAVLQYMDQLLDALPQEKITDFAKSEHFETYKKLFEELGI
jgi:pilus assembly protein FimV